jgi:hypothetical protein
MNKDELREMVEEIVDDKDKVGEILELFEGMDSQQILETVETTKDQEINLKLLFEEDWKKRAALAAMKISNGLDK